MRIDLSRHLDPEEAARLISDAADNTDELYDFVVALDCACADWGLTERLYDYFQTEMEKLAAEKDAEAAA